MTNRLEEDQRNTEENLDFGASLLHQGSFEHIFEAFPLLLTIQQDVSGTSCYSENVLRRRSFVRRLEMKKIRGNLLLKHFSIVNSNLNKT